MVDPIGDGPDDVSLYPHWREALLTVGQTQHCAVCGNAIIMRPGSMMTFVNIEESIRTLHGECDPRSGVR